MLSEIGHSIYLNLRLLTLISLVTGLTACAGMGITSEEIGLSGPSYHTGTLTILRVDDAWHPDPEERGHYRIGSGIQNKQSRFVPLRGKTDMAGLDGPDRIVTKDDLVTITLNSAFIKFFSESGKRTASGEIAVVLSFSAGSTVRENLLIHSSRGQTLGSFLDLQDWPVAGPVRIDGDSLLVRIVIIELDQQENEHKRQTIRALAGIGTTINPGLGPVFSITQQIADFIISQNSDDVIFDQKFGLKRVDSSLPATVSPLLYGKYVLLMQEDKFANRDVSAIVPLSTSPPEVDDMRYDTEFARVAKVYNYFPNPELKECERCQEGDIDVQKDFLPTFGRSLYEGVGRIDYASFFPQPDKNNLSIETKCRPCVLKKLVNGEAAKELRKSELGYHDPVVGELELYNSLDTAFKIAYLEGIRHFPVSVDTKDETKSKSKLGNLFNDARPDGEVFFNYPVTQYPEAYTLVAQYPLHTHLVFSIDRSLGGDGQKFHERFQTFVDFMNDELQSARDEDRIGKLAETLNHTVQAYRAQQVLLRNVDRLKKKEGENQEQFAQRRVCFLWKDGLRKSSGNGTSDSSLSDAPIYNEIFHITGRLFSNRDEVKAYLEENGCEANNQSPSCECKSTEPPTE